MVILDYVRAFRESYLAGTAIIPVEHRSRLAHLPFLGEDYHVAAFESPKGCGFRFMAGAGDDTVTQQSRPLHRFAFPSLGFRTNEQTGVKISGQSSSLMLDGKMTNASLEVSDSKVVTVDYQWIDTVPVKLTHSAAEVLIYNGTLRTGIRRDVIELAKYFGTSETERFSAVAAQRDAMSILMTAATELQFEAMVPKLANFSEQVLLLGDFSPEGRSRLQRIRDALASRGQGSFTVEDVADVAHLDVRGKVLACILLCKYVIMDDSSRGGQMAEVSFLTQNRRPAAIVRLEGTYSSAMMTGVGGFGAPIQEYVYKDGTLDAVITEASVWAEGRVSDLESIIETYEGWREYSQEANSFPLGLQPWLVIRE